ncbi:MAG: hydantoinase/oxoprolinase N-terminal domain-containing protein, partial [Pseudomonadota bacterium]
MTLALGIDTGGTYTDAVLFDTGTDTVRAAAKSLTTHSNLQAGVAGAIAGVFADSTVAPRDIELVSVSTTLATNALVEG